MVSIGENCKFSISEGNELKIISCHWMQLGRNGSVLRYHLVEMDKEDDYLNDMADNGSFSFIF